MNELESEQSQLVEGYSKTTGGQHGVSPIEFENKIFKNQSNLKCQVRYNKENEYDDYGDQRSYNSTNNGLCIEEFNKNFRQSHATEQYQGQLRSSIRNALSNDHIDINSYDEYKNSQNDVMVNKSQKELDTKGAFFKSSLNDRMQDQSKRNSNRKKSTEESIYCHTDRNIEGEEIKNFENQKPKKNSHLIDQETTDRIWKKAEKMIIKRGLSNNQDSNLPIQIYDYKNRYDRNASKTTPEKIMNTYETVNQMNDQYKQLQFNGSFGKDLLKNEEYFNTRNDQKIKSPLASQIKNEQIKYDYQQYQYSNLQNRNVPQFEHKIDGKFIQQIGNHLNMENSKYDKNQNYQSEYFQRKNSTDQTGDNKYNNFSLLNQNLNLTHDLLQRAKAQRIKLNKSYQDSFEPKSFKEDQTDYDQYNQNPDTEKQMNTKDNNYMLTMKEITERSEGTELSDEYSRFMKNQNSSKIIKNSSKNQQEVDSLNYLEVPKPSVKSNLKRTYEWLLSNNDGEVKVKNSQKKSERQDKSFDVASPYVISEFEEKQKLYGLMRSQSRDSNNQSQIAQRGRKRDTHSNEKSYHKIISPDIISNQMQSFYANQKTSPEIVQFQVNKSLNEISDTLQQKNNLQAPGRILRQYQKQDSYQYLNNQNRSKSHNSNIQSYNFSYLEDEKKCQEQKPNVSQKLNNVLEQLNQKSKFNIERTTYDQILYKVKSHADNSALYPQQITTNIAPTQTNTQNMNNTFATKVQTNLGTKYLYDGKQAVSDFKTIFPTADPKLSSSIIQDMKISPSKLTLITDQSDILQASNGFQATPTNQNKSEPLNMQQWLPHIYTELCKCRASLAQKDTDIKLRDDQLLQKNAEIDQLKQKLIEFNNLQNNYDLLLQEIKQKDEHIKNYELGSQKMDSFEKENEMKKLLKKRESQIKHQYKIEMEWIERIDALISVQKLFNHPLNNKAHVQNLLSSNQEKQNPKPIFSKILNKLEVLFSDIKLQQKKDNQILIEQANEINSLKNENQQIIIQNQQELELINKNFCELFNQREDLEKVVEFLKQIILLQEKLNKSDNNQQNNSEIKLKVQKCIEEFMNEEKNKISLLNKLQWVQDISDASLTIEENDKYVNSEQITINDNKFYQQNQKMEKIIELDNEDTIIETLPTKQQTFGDKYSNQKQINTQTDNVKTGSEFDADSKSAQSNCNLQTDKVKLEDLSNRLKSNQGDLLSVQLTKYLHENMKEISNIKMENGRLLEKHKNEQKTVLKLKEELKRKQKYEQFFVNQKQKKYRNCGCQAGPSQIKQANNSVHSHSQQQSKLYNKQYTEVYVSQKKTVDEQKENDILNKENAYDTNHIKQNQIENLAVQQKVLNVVTGNIDMNSNITKSPLLSGNKAVSPLCLSSFHTSNNTHNLLNKLAVPDLSEDGKEVQLRSKSNLNERSATQNSKLSNMSPNLMTSLNIDEESYSPSMQDKKAVDSKPELNTNDQKLLKYHIKQSQELYQVLQSYITKLQVQTEQKFGSQEENHLLNQSKTIIKSIELSANQLSQYSNQQKIQLQQNIFERKRHDSRKDSQTLSQNTVKNMHQEDGQGNTSSDFEEQPIHHKSQDMLHGKQASAFYQNNQQWFNVANSECNNRLTKENSEQTKICNYVDEYFNYKNQLMMIHKEQLEQNMILDNSPSYSNDISNPGKTIKNYTARQSIEKISPRKQNKDKSFNEEKQKSSKKVRLSNIKQPKSQYEGLGELINGGVGSIGIRSRRQSLKQDCQKSNQEDENRSECIDVSEQIKQIEGREILDCKYLDAHQSQNTFIQ